MDEISLSLSFPTIQSICIYCKAKVSTTLSWHTGMRLKGQVPLGRRSRGTGESLRMDIRGITDLKDDKDDS